MLLILSHPLSVNPTNVTMVMHQMLTYEDKVEIEWVHDKWVYWRGVVGYILPFVDVVVVVVDFQVTQNSVLRYHLRVRFRLMVVVV